jgi:hypothetical protein
MRPLQEGAASQSSVVGGLRAAFFLAPILEERVQVGEQ